MVTLTPIQLKQVVRQFRDANLLKSQGYVPSNQLVSIKEAASALAMSEQSIRLWANKGKIKSVVVGSKSRRIPASEIDRLAAGNDATTK